MLRLRGAINEKLVLPNDILPSLRRKRQLDECSFIELAFAALRPVVALVLLGDIGFQRTIDGLWRGRLFSGKRTNANGQRERGEQESNDAEDVGHRCSGIRKNSCNSKRRPWRKN